jgi:hypothetical protein
VSPPGSLSVVQDRGSLTQSQAGYLWRGPWGARATPQSKRGRRRRLKMKSNLTARILKADSQNNDNAKSDNAYDVAVAECG